LFTTGGRSPVIDPLEALADIDPKYIHDGLWAAPDIARELAQQGSVTPRQ